MLAQGEYRTDKCNHSNCISGPVHPTRATGELSPDSLGGLAACGHEPRNAEGKAEDVSKRLLSFGTFTVNLNCRRPLVRLASGGRASKSHHVNVVGRITPPLHIHIYIYIYIHICIYMYIYIYIRYTTVVTLQTRGMVGPTVGSGCDDASARKRGSHPLGNQRNGGRNPWDPPKLFGAAECLSGSQLETAGCCAPESGQTANQIHSRQLPGLDTPSNQRANQSNPNTTRLWVKNRYPKWNPGKWKHGLKAAVPWWFNFDPYPHPQGNHAKILKGWQYLEGVPQGVVLGLAGTILATINVKVDQRP